MSQSPIYLDKIVSSPHFPRPEGSLDPTSKVILPNLKRTGIRSKYSKSWKPPAVDAEGKLTQDYLLESTEKIRSLMIYDTEKLKADKGFNLPHRSVLNNRLIRLDRKREEHLLKTRNQLTEDTRSFGFEPIHSNTLCPSPEHISRNTSSKSNCTMKSRTERKKEVYSRMTLFQSMFDLSNNEQSNSYKSRFDVSKGPPTEKREDNSKDNFYCNRRPSPGMNVLDQKVIRELISRNSISSINTSPSQKNNSATADTDS
jgi:hypothetical protein